MSKQIVTLDPAGMVICVTEVPPGFENRPEAVVVPAEGTHHIVDAGVKVDLGMARLESGAFALHPLTIAKNNADQEALVRRQRNQLLAQADNEVEKAIDDADAVREAAWRRYRQLLRAVPEQPGFPVAVDWPTQP